MVVIQGAHLPSSPPSPHHPCRPFICPAQSSLHGPDAFHLRPHHRRHPQAVADLHTRRPRHKTAVVVARIAVVVVLGDVAVVHHSKTAAAWVDHRSVHTIGLNPHRIHHHHHHHGHTDRSHTTRHRAAAPEVHHDRLVDLGRYPVRIENAVVRLTSLRSLVAARGCSLPRHSCRTHQGRVTPGDRAAD